MADIDGIKEAKHYYSEIPQAHEGFFLKGAHRSTGG